jgi:hypothetical protein
MSVAPQNWAIMAPEMGPIQDVITKLLIVALGQQLPLGNKNLSGINLFTMLLFAG